MSDQHISCILEKLIDMIELSKRSCSCSLFLKNAICFHALSYSHINDLEWFGPQWTNKATGFTYLTKNRAPKGCRERKMKALER